MKIIKRVRLIDEILDTISKTWYRTPQDVAIKQAGSFFIDLGIERPLSMSYHNLRSYANNWLQNLDDDKLIEIAKELETDISYLTPPAKPDTPPAKIKHDSSPAKAFISHLAIGKIGAINLSDALQEYNIQGFVAHEDIEPSKQWQDEIEKALNKMDFFISLHTKGFSQSVWCQQEVGFAVAKGVEIVSIKFDEDPAGFIGKYQALAGTNNIVNDITNIFNILQNSSKTKDLYSAKIADKVAQKPIEMLADKYKI